MRPGHFTGVATIVTKLLNVVRPDLAFFGEKDYQQLAVVRRLARDLDLGVGIVGARSCATRMALHSRAATPTSPLPSEPQASRFPPALWAAASELMLGERDARALEAAMRAAVTAHAGDALALDYAAIVDPETLEPLVRVEATARAIIAGRVGATRLIDNCALTIPSES